MNKISVWHPFNCLLVLILHPSALVYSQVQSGISGTPLKDVFAILDGSHITGTVAFLTIGVDMYIDRFSFTANRCRQVCNRMKPIIAVAIPDQCFCPSPAATPL